MPSGERWIHEIKFDGYRVQVHLRDAAIKVFTRRGNDWTNRFRKIAADAWHIGAGSAIIDGEVVIPAEDGTTDFSVLQNERKALLRKIIDKTDIQFSESFEIDGREMYKHACKTGLEGVVSKVRDSRYVSGRVNDWVKKTCAQRETLAIAGFALDGGKWDGLYLGGYHLIEMLRQSLFGLPDTRTSTTRTGSVAIATLCLLT